MAKKVNELAGWCHKCPSLSLGSTLVRRGEEGELIDLVSQIFKDLWSHDRSDWRISLNDFDSDIKHHNPLTRQPYHTQHRQQYRHPHMIIQSSVILSCSSGMGTKLLISIDRDRSPSSQCGGTSLWIRSGRTESSADRSISSGATVTD